MSSALKSPSAMNVAEFLAWNPRGPDRWQLVDGEPAAQSRASRTQGTLLAELAGRIGNHLAALGDQWCAVAYAGIIPRVRASDNFRTPGLAVTCTGYETEAYDVRDPVLIVDVLSPANRAEIWSNVWSFTTIPSLCEVLLLSSTATRADLLRRGSDGSWPADPTVIKDGDLVLESIGFSVALASIYRSTRLARL